jgi:GntR family transcriptional regulator/GntR family frlABCD operon transcriptional regulator
VKINIFTEKKIKTIPQHRRLYEILRRHILDGVYKEGNLLPSENELCQIYGMTRPTVRQSLSSLASDGYIIKHQGKGSIVHSLQKEIGILSVSGTTSAVGNRNLKTKIVVKPTTGIASTAAGRSRSTISG